MYAFVTFDINDQLMGLDMRHVEKIIRLPRITQIPSSPDYIEGVIDFQNNLIHVINLKKKFHLDSTEIMPDSNIIIIVNENQKSGIIVDCVNDIKQISERDILITRNNSDISGSIKDGDDVINLLNANALIVN
jgi:purine-binding chemotaxis protein CheW